MNDQNFAMQSMMMHISMMQHQENQRILRQMSENQQGFGNNAAQLQQERIMQEYLEEEERNQRRREQLRMEIRRQREEEEYLRSLREDDGY